MNVSPEVGIGSALEPDSRHGIVDIANFGFRISVRRPAAFMIWLDWQ